MLHIFVLVMLSHVLYIFLYSLYFLFFVKKIFIPIIYFWIFTFYNYFFFFTGPNPPQNITVAGVTSSQIALSWAPPESTNDALFERCFLCWVDEASGRGRGLWLNGGNLSAVIGGLKAYRAYRISLVSVTADGVESSEATPLVVITGKTCQCNYWHPSLKKSMSMSATLHIQGWCVVLFFSMQFWKKAFLMCAFLRNNIKIIGALNSLDLM